MGVRNEENDPPLEKDKLQEYEETYEKFAKMVQTNMKGGTDLISKIMAKILERNVKLQVPE